ncbi:MAG: hypothetical protein AB1806_11830 [Acidobacteriota bacterium]
MNPTRAVKYGTFTIVDNVGSWTVDGKVRVVLAGTKPDSGRREGFWTLCRREPKREYHAAVGGLCLWSKYDCVFCLEPRGRGNPGAERSLSNPRDRTDLLARLARGQRVDRLVAARDPLGPYQEKMIDWQADVVRRYGIQTFYYSVPVDEYAAMFREFECFLPRHCVEQVHHRLRRHGARLEERIREAIPACIEFLHPMRQDPSLSPEESYVWPYRHLSVDLGIEEMEDVRIPYEAMKSGATLPPILLGMLGLPNPYYVRRANPEELDDLLVG